MMSLWPYLVKPEQTGIRDRTTKSANAESFDHAAEAIGSKRKCIRSKFYRKYISLCLSVLIPENICCKNTASMVIRSCSCMQRNHTPPIMCPLCMSVSQNDWISVTMIS